LKCSQAKYKSFPFTSCFKTGSLENEIDVALPTAELKEFAPGVSLLPPLTRRGYGPGLIIMLPNGTPSYKEGGTLCEDGVPPPLLKWSEEGYAVVQILGNAFEQAGTTKELLNLAISGLKNCPECHEEDGIGMQSQFYCWFIS
jgi:carboxymethylenebutenolidase